MLYYIVITIFFYYGLLTLGFLGQRSSPSSQKPAMPALEGVRRSQRGPGTESCQPQGLLKTQSPRKAPQTLVLGKG